MPSEPLDFEDIAIQRLAKRARGVYVRVGITAALFGIIVGQVAAWIGLQTVGVLPGFVYGGLFLGPLLGALYLGREHARATIRRRSDEWSEEMAQEYQLNAEQLRKYIEHM